jgi:hypothetical protein
MDGTKPVRKFHCGGSSSGQDLAENKKRYRGSTYLPKQPAVQIAKTMWSHELLFSQEKSPPEHMKKVT